MRIVLFIFEKYQKIPEKRETSFHSLKNKNWTFRGSFDIFSTRLFLNFLSVYFYTIINECLSLHIWCKNERKNDKITNGTNKRAVTRFL